MIYGLAAALGFGLSDLGAAVVTRRIGSMATVVISQVAGLVAVATLFFVLRPTFEVSPADLALLVLNGTAAAGGFLTYYRALELGPVALVAPIASAFPVVTVSLSVLLLGESLAGTVLWGAVLTIVGVVLTSTDLHRVGVRVEWQPSGVPFAVASMALFGVATFILGESSQKVGWLAALIVARATLTAALLFVGALRRRGARWVAPAAMQATVLVGLLAAFGDAMYARGSELGQVSITITLSSTATLIVVAGGVLLFHERPAANQAVGIALVIIGLVLFGITS